MTAHPIAAIQLERVRAPAGVAPRRLAVIARKRLQDLGIPSFVVGDTVRGRLTVDPRRLQPWEEVGFELKQEFVVQGHDRIWFLQPSILRFVGAIPFYDIGRVEDLVTEIERRWAGLHKQTTEFRAMARRYFPQIRLNPETWTLDVDVTDPFGVVHLRVRPYQGRVWAEVFGVDRGPIQARPGEDRLIMALPPDPAMFDRHALDPLLNRVRAGATPTAAKRDTMVLELDLGLDDDDDAVTVIAAPVLDAPVLDEDASLDLALLLTGDLATGAPDLEMTMLGADAVEELDTPIPKRLTRLKTGAIPVRVSTAHATVAGIVRDLNRSGVFIDVDEPETFVIGSTIFLSGLGPFVARARVRHVRGSDEGNLLGTGSGIGVSLVGDPVARQVGPGAPVLVLTDTDIGDDRAARYAAIVVGAARVPIIVRDLPEALMALRNLPVHAIVLDQSFREYSSRELDDALGFQEIGRQLVVVSTEIAVDQPPGVCVIAANQLSSYLATHC